MTLQDIPHNYPWLFTDVVEAIVLDDYLKYFVIKHNMRFPFHYHYLPALYDLKLLENYKRQLFNTSTVPGQIVSIFQLSPKVHFIAHLIQTDEELVECGIEIFASSNKDYIDFVIKNKDFEKRKRQSVGFVPATKQ